MNENQNFLKTSVLTFIKASVGFTIKYWILFASIINMLVVVVLLNVKSSFYIKMVLFLILNFIFVCSYYIYKIYKVQKTKIGFPIRSVRYTQKLGDMVFIKEKYKYDAVLYLYELENELENMGVYLKGE